MDFTWTKHRFSGGLLAFDLANTVLHRHDSLRRQDRLAVPQNINQFVVAAQKYRSDEFASGEVIAPEQPKEVENLLQLRESIDDLVRPSLTSGVPSSETVMRLFNAAAKVGRGANMGGKKLPFAYYVSISAMRLLDHHLMQLCKICPQCGWLFVDRSKNRSRVWCDMAVCGNRTKAKAHYDRRVAITKQAKIVE
jgi:predicted RNA-binding Zn ribbon-like protein